jgi:hypothetical protein
MSLRSDALRKSVTGKIVFLHHPVKCQTGFVSVQNLVD